MPIKLGYNTNGFPYHRLEDALHILADLGYQSVALTLDYHSLDPFAPDCHQRARTIRSLLDRLNLESVIETGARFLLDPWRKHQPTLLSPTPEERSRRIDFLVRAMEIALELGSTAVSFWSGMPTTDEPDTCLMRRLTEGCRLLADFAERQRVRLAFEPEPGMFIDTLAKFAPLQTAIGSPWFGLTIDIGHLQCLEEPPISDHLAAWKDWLWNIHIEDMRRGVHDHLLFGEGEIDFAPVLHTLRDIAYPGGLHVELSRHGHDAVATARRARDFLQACGRD